MVQIIQEQSRHKKGTPIGEQFSKAFSGGLQAYEKMQEDKALEEMGVDTRIKDPAYRSKMLAQKMTQDASKKQAVASQKVNYSLDGTTPETKRFIDENKSEAGSEPTSQKSSKQIEQSKLEETKKSREKKPVLAPDQLMFQGKRIAEERTQAGQHTDAEEGYEIARKLNADNEAYNEGIAAKQQQYGDLAVSKLENLFSDATDEHRARFQKKGELAFERGLSESAINQEMSEEARKFKNMIAKVKGSVPAARFMSHAFGGPDRNWESTKKDLQLKLKPLLDDGLYDTARNLLSELGYHAEERESIVSSLGEYAKKGLAEMPSMAIKKANIWDAPTKEDGKYVSAGEKVSRERNSPERMEKITQSLGDILSKDPSSNLILLRKGFEDKDVEWDQFKDALNQLADSGQIELNPDQFNQLNDLDMPALSGLDKFLHSVKLIGR